MVIQLSDSICDLHTHSTASDGSDTPAMLVSRAARASLRAVALTDHDTIAGLDEASAAAEIAGVEFVSGVELSVRTSTGNMHILGYLMDMRNEKFRSTLEKVQFARAERTPRLLGRLKELGLPISRQELLKVSGGGQVGRPHFARIMVEKGYVKNVSQAFLRYLKRGAPAYVPKSILTPSQAIESIHAAGGLAVLAHPFSLMCSTINELRSHLRDLCDRGLDGMECYYSEHSHAYTSQCLELCREFKIVPTGGSDYHGKAKPYIKIGRGRGDLVIPYRCVQDLRVRRQEKMKV